MLALSFAATSARAATFFSANLIGAEEVGPVVTTAHATATFELNDDQTALAYSITIVGLDLDGNQTPGTADDNVTGIHIHAAPLGINGGVVFGMRGLVNDLDDQVVDAGAGTVIGVWDGVEGNGTTLAAQLTALFNEGLYINVHTTAHPGGEIRGQIIPEPASAVVLAFGAASLLRRRPW
ncbi:MAG: CHRD domain-containing protein [Phycisphaeraceae bacterium]|nr:CHRD domain-containing protein [Phycisphaeraceae bacterium]